jgi:hypothetical protein
MQTMTRRQFFRMPLVALAFALAPKWMMSLFPAPAPQPDLRAIGESIKEILPFMIFSPTGPFPPVTKPQRVTVPIFELASMPMISLDDIKRRRFEMKGNFFHENT